jgi:cytochrome c556
MALRQLHGSRFVLALGLVAGLAGVALAATPDELFEKRVAAMKANGGALKALGAAAKAGTITPEDVAKAQGLVDVAIGLPELFTEGSITPKSRALPEIWTNKAGWDEKLSAFQAAADTVLASAKSGDPAALGAAVDKAGEACGACHKIFRGPEK